MDTREWVTALQIGCLVKLKILQGKMATKDAIIVAVEHNTESS
jgi:hypothetical protein